jgi:hypothetical protein
VPGAPADERRVTITVRRGSSAALHDRRMLAISHGGGDPMRKTLLLVATLGTLAMLPEPAAAGGYGPGHPRTASFSGLWIFVLPAPRIVRHNDHRPGQLRPQPVFRFGPPRPCWQSLPRAGSHQPWPRPPHHLERRFDGRQPWRLGSERHHGPRVWQQAPGRHQAGRGRGKP